MIKIEFNLFSQLKFVQQHRRIWALFDLHFQLSKLQLLLHFSQCNR